MVPDPQHTRQALTSADSVGEDDDSTMYNCDVLNQIEISGLPSHQITLQQFAVIMLLRNLDPGQGLVNGARMMVLKFTRTLITAKLITGDFKGQLVLIPRITLSPNEGRLPFKLNRLQFPVKLAYAMTINKSQGQTLRRVGLYLPDPVFDHGQLFVAFSWVGLPSDIRALILDNASQGRFNGCDGVYTRNVVYKSILLQMSIISPTSPVVSSDSFSFASTDRDAFTVIPPKSVDDESTNPSDHDTQGESGSDSLHDCNDF